MSQHHQNLTQRIMNNEFRNLTVKPPSMKNKDQEAERKYKEAEQAKADAFKSALEADFFKEDTLSRIKSNVLKEMFVRASNVGGASQLEAMDAYKDFAEIMVLQLFS